MPTMILNRHRSLIKVVNYRKITVGIPTICMILAVNAALDAGRLFSNAGSSQHMYQRLKSIDFLCPVIKSYTYFKFHFRF